MNSQKDTKLVTHEPHIDTMRLFDTICWFVYCKIELVIIDIQF